MLLSREFLEDLFERSANHHILEYLVFHKKMSWEDAMNELNSFVTAYPELHRVKDQIALIEKFKEIIISRK